MITEIPDSWVPVAFENPFGTGKWYARLPSGEWAWSDSQGLYEWRRVPFDWPEGAALPGPGCILQRIDYSGGDRQGSDRTGFWSHGDSGSALLVYPAVLGIQAALSPVRMN
jgi:hypothetical protein